MRKRAVYHTVTHRHGPTAGLVKTLLLWFTRNARPLPWRRTTDPYAIWVSESMLQQTQVATVIPYWERWMRELPTLASLAHAPEQTVLKLWEGLGYYRRARHLQTAARHLQNHHHGQFPDTLAEVLALPGVGRYTAGAILSIAFNQPVPVLDGNVQRVLCRFHGIHRNPRHGRTQKQLWSLAEAWVVLAAKVEQQNPRTFARACSALNQALMELGAVVCTARQPSCNLCPLRYGCHALAQGQTDKLPLREQRTPAFNRLTLAAVVVAGDGLLVRQRPQNGVNGGLWEFPNCEMPAPGRSPIPTAAAKRKLAAWLRQELGIPANNFHWLHTLQHTITKHRYEVQVWRAAALRQPPKDARTRWVTRTDLQHLPMPAVHRRMANLLT